MKRMIIALLIAAGLISGCDGEKSQTQEETTMFEEPTETFQIVAFENYFYIVVDKETRVMYAVSNGMYNRGTLTMLVDENGKPRLWEGKIVEWKGIQTN